jgi:hypothetical protein
MRLGLLRCVHRIGACQEAIVRTLARVYGATPPWVRKAVATTAEFMATRVAEKLTERAVGYIAAAIRRFLGF